MRACLNASTNDALQVISWHWIAGYALALNVSNDAGHELVLVERAGCCAQLCHANAAAKQALLLPSKH